MLENLQRKLQKNLKELELILLDEFEAVDTQLLDIRERLHKLEEKEKERIAEN